MSANITSTPLSIKSIDLMESGEIVAKHRHLERLQYAIKTDVYINHRKIDDLTHQHVRNMRMRMDVPGIPRPLYRGILHAIRVSKWLFIG